MAITQKHSVIKVVATVKAILARETAITRLVQDLKKAALNAEQLLGAQEEPKVVNTIWDFIRHFENLDTTFSRMAEGLKPALDEFKKDFPEREAP